MAEVKISALSSATTPLAGTELVPIVQGGVTKNVAVSSLGGQTVSVLGKYAQGTVNGTTTITKSASILIASNSINLGDTIGIKATFTNNGGIPYVMETYIYTNTSDTLTGATLVGKAQVSSTYGWCGMERTFVYADYYGMNSFIGTSPSSFLNSDMTGTPYYGNIVLNNSVSNYIIFATKISSAFGGADARLNQAVITKI